MKHMLAYPAFGVRSDNRQAARNNLPAVSEVRFTADGRITKRALKPYRDYKDANSTGSRGVVEHFLIEQGKLYEIWEPQSWKRARHYFAIHDGNGLIELSFHEALRYVRT